ncbi:MAG: phosphopantetheine-binding protein [Verrucomicrobiota bacterium]|nr:phosphopantetheine-binding protein [Verrucomicrobiota bacterium]
MSSSPGMCTRESARAFVLRLVERKARLPGGVEADTFNYFDSGYVDSIEITKFLVEIESAFNIEILNADIQSSDFRTVGGLVSIIMSKMAAKSASLPK